MLLNWCLDDSLSIRELEFKPGFVAKIARRPEVLEVTSISLRAPHWGPGNVGGGGKAAIGMGVMCS
jgi:hypothetical protein